MSARLAVVAAVGFAGACGGGQGGSDTAATDIVSVLDRAETGQLTPSRDGAASYVSIPASRRQLAILDDDLRAGLFRSIADGAKANGVTVLPDERLDAVTADLARSLGDGEEPASDAVEFLLAHHGIVEPYPRLRVLRVDEPPEGEASDEEVARSILEAFRMPSRNELVTLGIGINRATSQLTVVLAVQPKHVDLEPVARAHPSGATIRLAGKLLDDYQDPKVYVTVPSGEVRTAALPRGAREFELGVTCADGDGRYQLEVFGTDDRGPRVLANFPVFCGVEPPAVHDGKAGFSPEPVTVDEAEAKLFELVNEARAEAGLEPVARDKALADVARTHSEDMRDNDYFAHRSPSTGGAADRVEAAGLSVPRRLLENIARASAIADVHKGLMHSPGHRSAMLDPDVTHVGIGVAVKRDSEGFEILATQLFR